jgi:adenylate cyclase
MKFSRRQVIAAMTTATGAVALFAALAGLAPDSTVRAWREASTDAILAEDPPASDAIVVVDIDSASLRKIGPWPWPRERTNQVLATVAAGHPRVMAVDILLEDADRLSPRALAGRLDPGQGAEALRKMLLALPDADERLAHTLASVPTVLSMLFGPRSASAPPPAPVILAGEAPRFSPWIAEGALAPLPAFAASAKGLGVASLDEEPGGRVRRAPLFGVAGDAVVAGFAAETLRVAENAGSFILRSEAGRIDIGSRRLPLDPDLTLRFRPGGPAQWIARTVSAGDVLGGTVDPARFRDKIVLVGSGAPELGALRATAASAIAPSVQIQADALATMLSGRIPFRPPYALPVEIAALVILSLMGAFAGAVLGPLVAASITLAASLAWSSITAAMAAFTGLLIDPLTPVLAMMVAALTSGTMSAIHTRRRETALRRRFEQHLDPAVVSRIVERPGLVRFEGERREITALFTDIEGFTALTERVGPTHLLSLLDDYFAGVVAIVLSHGGMVDKFVGDAVHAFFNAPLDLSDHPRKALAAAREIIDFTNAFSQTEKAVKAGLGRTRIGIETGEVIIGDVGSGGKLDYTAHGSAVNTAARLEAMNKTFATSICVGPVFRSRLPDEAFRRLGEIEVRGRGLLDIYTPETTETTMRGHG